MGSSQTSYFRAGAAGLAETAAREEAIMAECHHRRACPDIMVSVPHYSNPTKRREVPAKSGSLPALPQIPGLCKSSCSVISGSVPDLRLTAEEEREAQRRVNSLARELQRNNTRAARARHLEKRELGARELQQRLDARSGKALTEALARVEPAEDDEVTALSRKFHAKLAEVFPVAPEKRQWFVLFKLMDEDNSGRIGYNELSWMVRERMRMGHKALSEAKLRSVWRALDTDGSGEISAGEFGAFMRRGQPFEEGPSRLEVQRKKSRAKFMSLQEEMDARTVRSGVGEKVASDFWNSWDSWDSPDLTAGAEEPMSGLEPAMLAAMAFVSRPFGPRSPLSLVSRCTSSRSAHAPAPPAGECACPSCGAGRHARFACTGRSGCGATRRPASSWRHAICITAVGGRADRATTCAM